MWDILSGCQNFVRCFVVWQKLTFLVLVRMENATNLMDKCHRVIIILTAQYVSDNWSVFQLQQVSQLFGD